MIQSDSKYNAILNPHQREFLEDEKRFKEKMEQLNELQNQDVSPSRLFARPKEIKEDPDLLDRHDSFYITTKSLLVLFQIMGVMPIKRSAPKLNQPRTTFKFTSRVFMWAFLVWSLETIIVVIVAKERITQFANNSDKKFDEIIYNVIFISILVPHFVLPVASWRHGPQVAIFKNMWTNYQVKYLKVTGSPIVFPNLYPLTWGLCIFSWALSITIMLAQYYLQPDFELWHTFAYYHILAMLNGFCSLWYINCTAFGIASKALSLSLQDTLKGEKPAQKLTEYRHLWVDLSHMMQQLGIILAIDYIISITINKSFQGRAYSNMYGIYCLVIFFTTIIATYGSLSEILDHGATYKEVGLFLIVFYCMSLLFIICNEADIASRRVGLNFQTKLLNVNLNAVDTATTKEIEMFLVAISKNPPTMNLDGYANINRQLITTNVSFMATYLVVLLQFKITLLRQTARTAAVNILRMKANGTTPMPKH